MAISQLYLQRNTRFFGIKSHFMAIAEWLNGLVRPFLGQATLGQDSTWLGNLLGNFRYCWSSFFLPAGEIFVKQKSMGNNSFGVKPFPDYWAPGPWSKMVRTLFNKIVCNSWFWIRNFKLGPVVLWGHAFPWLLGQIKKSFFVYNGCRKDYNPFASKLFWVLSAAALKRLPA